MGNYWAIIWKEFYKHPLGRIAFYVIVLFCLVGIYAPFLASSKPLFVEYDEAWFFPLFRYLFYRGYYTKGLDLFFNIMIFTVPLALLLCYFLRHHSRLVWLSLSSTALLQMILFSLLLAFPVKKPSFDRELNHQRQQALLHTPYPSWHFDLKYMSPYAKLDLILDYQQQVIQQQNLAPYQAAYKSASQGRPMPTLWQQAYDSEQEEIARQKQILQTASPSSDAALHAEATINYLNERRQWLEQQLHQLHYEVMPLVCFFHWEDDAGGSQKMNRFVPFWELTRLNRKDLVAALIFGVRISLVVGILSVALALIIGLPIGALAGFYGGKFDIIVCRMIEIWESMPTFFMLLMVIAILQSKSIFLVITIIGIFGWTSFSRYLRGEFFKQRNLAYIEACHAIGLPNKQIIFSHILPNALPPVLTLLPFAIMGAISSEAGLSFLGLGEEGSCSWGVIMDEGRSAFPSESYLLWPPAILLTLLLVSIALVGDAFRDALDPKHR